MTIPPYKNSHTFNKLIENGQTANFQRKRCDSPPLSGQEPQRDCWWNGHRQVYDRFSLQKDIFETRHPEHGRDCLMGCQERVLKLSEQIFWIESRLIKWCPVLAKAWKHLQSLIILKGLKQSPNMRNNVFNASAPPSGLLQPLEYHYKFEIQGRGYAKTGTFRFYL